MAKADAKSLNVIVSEAVIGYYAANASRIA
jgi:hypothetical protein